MQSRLPEQPIDLQQIVDGAVIEQKGRVAHCQRGQRDHKSRGFEFLRDASGGRMGGTRTSYDDSGTGKSHPDDF